MSNRGYYGIALVNPKSSVNVGSVLRNIGVYGADFLMTTGKRFDSRPTDVGKQYRHTPYYRLDDVDMLRRLIPYDCEPIAVELVEGAEPLHTFKHPQRCVYIFGQEDGTLDNKVLSWCKRKIYVQTPGPCMNLAVSTGVLMYDRLAKEQLK